MPNRLAHENSPYLLQHAENPVDWYPWGDEALEKARLENKPIFLSIGYAACHWCHVMEHESFEDRDTAALMNEHFVNIKVDREERPDLDHIYMQAVVAMTRQGGWPMSVFLTPEGRPFFGGTYFPPVRRYNMPSFREVLLSITRFWQEDREKILGSAVQVTSLIQQSTATGEAPGTIRMEKLNQAMKAIAQGYDWENGGWGQAPKFPQPMVIEVLLRQARRGDRLALQIAEHALQAMARGGMYDVVGGGFSRYSVDNYWRVPHFEKMLSDNAQLALVYLHAHKVTGNLFYRQICEETLGFVLREMTHPQGGFYSSMDADSEGQEGKFYVWTLDEIKTALPDPQDSDLIIAAYGLTEAGNFEGKNVLQRVLSDKQIAEEFGITQEQVPTKLAGLHARLLDFRSRRIRPGTDDKVITFWNGLMLAAFAEAGRYLNRTDYTQVAIQNADFLLKAVRSEDRLLRVWRNGQARYNAFLEDYAALILGLIALYQSDPQVRWFREAITLAEELVAHFGDPQGGFFDTRHDHETLIYRPKDTQDNATPSGNALAALALLQLSAYSGNGEWRSLAERMIGQMVAMAVKYPTSFGQWLTVLDFAVGPVYEVAIMGDLDSPRFQALQDSLWSGYQPRLVAALSQFPPEAESPPLLADRILVEGLPTAYVCQNFTCQLPVHTPDDLSAQLDGDSKPLE